MADCNSWCSRNSCWSFGCTDCTFCQGGAQTQTFDNTNCESWCSGSYGSCDSFDCINCSFCNGYDDDPQVPTVPIVFAAALFAVFALCVCAARHRQPGSSNTTDANTRPNTQATNSPPTTNNDIDPAVKAMSASDRELYIQNILKTKNYETSMLSVRSEQNERCAVCLDAFENSETVCGSHSCPHQFHRNCISSWLQSHDECPVCRQNFLALPDKASGSIWSTAPIDSSSRPTTPTTSELDVPYGLVEV